MRLDRFLASNWMNLRHGDFELAPLTLVAGDHATGKSAMRDGICFALTGESPRIDAKSERPDLISTGAAKGAVTLFSGDWLVARNIKDGKAKSEGALPLPEADRDMFKDVLPYVLDPARFIEADVSARRAVLMAAMRTPITPARVKAIMAERGVSADALKALDDKLGLASWFATAETAATEARGAWRAITGETYGEVKAEGWAPANVPENPTDERLQELSHAVETATAAIDTAKRAAAAARAAASVKEGALARAEAIIAGHPGKIAERTAARDQATQEQLDAAKDVAALQSRLPGKHLSCPHCQGAVTAAPGGGLIAYKPPAKPATQAEVDAADQKRIAAASQMVALGNEIATLEVELRQATAEAQTLKTAGDADDGPDLMTANLAITEAEGRHDRAYSAYMRAKADRNAAESASGLAQRAAAEHARVKLWTQIRDLVGVNGIPAELLGKALKPFNETLRTFAEETGWPQVSIGEDMSVLVGERRYALRSKSEQWRADAMIAIGLSGHSGLGFVLLDEADILNAEERSNLLSWLMELNGGGLDTAVVFATLNKRPGEMPEGSILHWMTAAEEERAAA